jgi:hypothetical protein
VCADNDFLILETDDQQQLLRLLKNSRGVTVPATYTVSARENRVHYYFRQSSKSLEYGKNPSLSGLFVRTARRRAVRGE